MIELRPGLELADYVLEHEIGHGGMGVVYRARESLLGRPVALKLIRTDIADSEEMRQRFLIEARATAAIDHPNVIPIYRVGQVEDMLFIAMRYVDGPSLGEVLSKEVFLEPDRAVDIVCQVASALSAAHGAGLVHRDVKPRNILLTTSAGSEHAYLADFGLARFVSAPGVTKSGQSIGTPAYMSPEQISNEPVDGRADIYALGCLLYEALTGNEPFEREEMHAVYFAHLQADPPDVSVANSALGEAFDNVVHRAMAKEPGSRFPDCEEFASSCREALETSKTELVGGPELVLVWGRHEDHRVLSHLDTACPRLAGEFIPPTGIEYAGVGTAGWMDADEATAVGIEKCEACLADDRSASVPVG